VDARLRLRDADRVCVRFSLLLVTTSTLRPTPLSVARLSVRVSPSCKRALTLSWARLAACSISSREVR
jgi:hypothetical protein